MNLDDTTEGFTLPFSIFNSGVAGDFMNRDFVPDITSDFNPDLVYELNPDIEVAVNFDVKKLFSQDDEQGTVFDPFKFVLNLWEGNNNNVILSENRPNYFVTIEIVLASLGIVLNLLHGIALKCISCTWKTNIKLIASLAVADILISILHLVQNLYVFPSVLVQYALQEYGPAQTSLSWIYSTAQFAQMLTMLGLAINLLIAIKIPLHFERLMSPGRGNIVISCFWIISALIFALVYLLTYKLAKENMIDALNGIFTITNFASTVSGIALVSVYSVAFYEIYNLKKRSPRQILLRKSALTFLSILITYIVLLMPGTWLEICSYFVSIDANHYDTLVKLKATISCMYVLNSVCDPILYAIRVPELNDSYRSIFQKLGCKCTREKKSNVISRKSSSKENNPMGKQDVTCSSKV